MNRPKFLALAALLLLGPAAFANIYGAIRGVVHDPQHRPIQNAMVMLKAKSSDWAKSVTTDATGEFQFNAIPLGDYSVSVASQGFAQTSQDVTVISGSEPVVHFLLKVATANANVTVSAAPEVAPTDSATPTTLVSRLDIERTPGASRSNSLAMITDFVPGAYVTHDQLHIRGGHQTSWLVDGVPVPNTNIASKISTTWRSTAAATARNSATGLMAYSTSFRAPDSSATTRPSWFSAPATSVKRMTSSASAVIRSASPTTSA